MKSHPQIAIVGGGPAGLTAAVILSKCGLPVRLYERERSRDHRGQGGSLDLHEDGGQIALQHAGLLEAFRAIARHEDQETRSLDPRSGVQIEGPVPDGDIDRPEIDRGDLRDLLLSALPSDAVEWNRSLEQLLPAGDGRWRLSFSDGSAAVADIVIGADGAWSRVRKALTAVVPDYSGATFIEGWIDAPTAQQREFVGHGTMFAFGGPEAIFAQKNGLGRICVYAAVLRSREWIKAERERQGLRELVISMFDGWAPQFQELLIGCGAFAERPIHQLPAGFAWRHQKGLYLVGDAAHLMPPVGVGVNLAMLDAADLAMAIAQADSWQTAAEETQAAICHRAGEIAQRAVPGFKEWFSEAASRLPESSGD